MPSETFALIYLFLLRSAGKLQKGIFFDNISTITQEKNMETRQMNAFLYLPFLFVKLIFEFENTQN